MLVNGKIQTHCRAEHWVLSVQVKSSRFLLVWPAVPHLIIENQLLNDSIVSSETINLSDEKGKISRLLLHRSPRTKK